MQFSSESGAISLLDIVWAFWGQFWSNLIIGDSLGILGSVWSSLIIGDSLGILGSVSRLDHTALVFLQNIMFVLLRLTLIYIQYYIYLICIHHFCHIPGWCKEGWLGCLYLQCHNYHLSALSLSLSLSLPLLSWIQINMLLKASSFVLVSLCIYIIGCYSFSALRLRVYVCV